MKFFHLIFIFASALALHADVPKDWSTDFTNTLAMARTSRKPALVFFTASWCGPCKLMSRLILTDPAIEDALTNVEHVAVDIDENSSVATQFGINAVPTLVLLTADGDELDRSTGFRPASEFLTWLTNSVFNVKAAVAQKQILQQKLADADQRLASSNAPGTELATELFDLCAATDQKIGLAAADRLKTLTTRNPALVLAGLNDPRLAVRIRAANALRAQLGDAFEVDAWSDAATREKAVENWKQRLATSAEPQTR